MQTLVTIGLWNAAGAAGLAVVAFAVSRAARRPALAHALWLLVLVKLLMPPVWTVRIPAWRAVDVGAVEASGATEVPAERGSTDVVVPAERAALRPASRVSAWDVGGFLWLSGTVGCVAATALRLARFRAVLGYGTAAPADVQRMTRDVAERVGLRRRVEAWVLPGRVCPMVWAGWGGPRVLLPGELWGRLSDDQRRRLLAHELAHVVRRDHWVRWLEVAATAVYWWNPVLWWARRELHEAEEACCDAWVAWAYPDEPGVYAEALVEAIDFAAVGGTVGGGALPALASGVGGFHSLQRRLVMIQQGSTGKSLGTFGTACAGAAVLLLPLTLGWAQVSTPGRTAAPGATPPPPPTSRPAAATQKASRDEQTDQRVRAMMDRKLPQLSFDSVGFFDVVSFLHDVSGINIAVDWKALEAAGIDRNTPVSLFLRDASFQKALDDLLTNASGGRAKLGYAIDHATIVISAGQGVPLVITAYSVKLLIDAQPALAGTIVADVVKAVDSASWQENGGKLGMIKLEDGKLYVTQTIDNQNRVAAYLGQLWAAQRRAAAATQKAQGK